MNSSSWPFSPSTNSCSRGGHYKSIVSAFFLLEIFLSRRIRFHGTTFCRISSNVFCKPKGAIKAQEKKAQMILTLEDCPSSAAALSGGCPKISPRMSAGRL